MTTATSSSFTLQEGLGRDQVTLTSYGGPITWPTTPVSGDQLEFPDSIVVTDAGLISGAAGTYTIRHIVAATGATHAVQYVLSSSTSANDLVAFETDLSDAFDYVVLTSYSGPMTFPTTPVAGDQIVYPSGVTVAADGSFTGPNATYDVYHIIAASGIIEAIEYTNAGANTAPTFGSVTDIIANVGDPQSIIDLTASDPDVGDVLTYSDDANLPSGVSRSGATLTCNFDTEQTVLSTFTVQDDSGDTGNDTDTLQLLFSIARSGYTITTLTVNYAGLNPDSGLIPAITDGDLEVGDQVDYPETVTDHVGATRPIGFSSDGLMIISGSRSARVPNVFIRDRSDSYIRKGPFEVIQKGTGPELTSQLEVVPNSATTSGGQMRFTSDEGSEVVGANGDYRMIAVASGFGTPTRAQVMAGLGPDGNAPLFDSGLLQQAATVSEVVTVTGLPTAGAGYWIFLCLEDQYGGRTLVGPVTLTTVSSGLPPVWSTVPNQVFSENADPNFDLGAYVTDSVSITLEWSPPLSQSTGVVFNSGVLGGLVNTNDAAGSPGVTTTHTVTATAANATAPSSTTFDVGFYRLNPPVAGTLANQSWQEGQAINFGLGTAITGATSYELEVDNGGFSDVTAELATYGLTFNSSTGVVSGTINATMSGNSPFSLRGRGLNADGNSSWITFSVIVNSASGAGFFGPIPDQSFNEGVSGSLNSSSYFTNAESYAISGLPLGTGISIDFVTGVITVVATEADAAQGTINAIITAQNTNGDAQGQVTIIIVSLNRPVLIASFSNIVAAVGDSFSITPINNFTGADSVDVIGIPANSGLAFDGTTFSGDFLSADKLASPYPITIRAINSDGNKDDTFLIEVTGAQFTDGTIVTPTVRTIVVGDKRSLSPKVFTQDVFDRIDYAVDLSAWLGADTIASATVASGDNLVVEGIKSTTAIQAFITGGTVGESEKVTARITTAEGRVLDTSFYIAFVDM